MTLPAPPTALDTATAELLGAEVSIRALSRAEALRFAELPTIGEKECYLIACATGTPYADVEAWLDKVPGGATEEFCKVVTALSGIGGGARFR